MALYSYNRMLGWVVASLVVWATLGIGLALGAVRQVPGRNEFKLGWRFEQAPQILVLPGLLRRVDEVPGRLTLTIEQSEAKRPHKPRPLPGLSVDYIEPGSLPPGPPEINLQGEWRPPRPLRRGGYGLLSKQFLLIYNDQDVRVLPRPEWMRPRERRDRQGMDQAPPPGCSATTGGGPKGTSLRSREGELHPQEQPHPVGTWAGRSPARHGTSSAGMIAVGRIPPSHERPAASEAMCR